MLLCVEFARLGDWGIYKASIDSQIKQTGMAVYAVIRISEFHFAYVPPRLYLPWPRLYLPGSDPKQIVNGVQLVN